MPVYRGSTVIHSGGGSAVNPVPFGQLFAESASAVTADLAYFIPTRILNAATVDLLGIRIFTSAGNIDVGIYDDNAGVPNNRLASTGIIASPGTGNRQTAVTEISPAAGFYWMALRASTTSFIPWNLPGPVSASGGLVDPVGATLRRPHTLALGAGVALPTTAAGSAAATTQAPVLWANHT